MRKILRCHERIQGDTEIAMFNLNNEVPNSEEAPKFKEIIVKQGNHIENLEAQCGMLYKLVLSLTKSSSHRNLSIGFALANPRG
jgi:hypothetical protein